jgi:2-dehydro-3-deoxyglucarate aldolase
VCKRLTKPAGFHVIPPEADMLNQKIKEGYLFLGFSLDTLFLGEKVRKELKEIKRK